MSRLARRPGPDWIWGWQGRGQRPRHPTVIHNLPVVSVTSEAGPPVVRPAVGPMVRLRVVLDVSKGSPEAMGVLGWIEAFGQEILGSARPVCAVIRAPSARVAARIRRIIPRRWRDQPWSELIRGPDARDEALVRAIQGGGGRKLPLVTIVAGFPTGSPVWRAAARGGMLLSPVWGPDNTTAPEGWRLGQWRLWSEENRIWRTVGWAYFRGWPELLRASPAVPRWVGWIPEEAGPVAERLVREIEEERIAPVKRLPRPMLGEIVEVTSGCLVTGRVGDGHMGAWFDYALAGVAVVGVEPVRVPALRLPHVLQLLTPDVVMFRHLWERQRGMLVTRRPRRPAPAGELRATARHCWEHTVSYMLGGS